MWQERIAIMCENIRDFYDPITRIEDAFTEIDSDICTLLLNSDSEYAALHREIGHLRQANPIIECVLDGEGGISLSADEHIAFVRYLTMLWEIKELERKQIYFQGHTDGFAYLVKIKAF